MLSQFIINHSSPTLAGLKLGNLFTYKFFDENSLYEEIESGNEVFNQKGVYLKVLQIVNNKALIYIYRKNQLLDKLKNEEIKQFLGNYGYLDFSIENALNILELNLKNEEFPHEIGVFLGYPLEDIKAFILNKGMNYKCVGIWKVYSNENLAKKTFEKYKKCKDVYCKKYKAGFDIMKLTVAG